ncbi:Uncharacterized protein BP5553_04351 [Venustampulla echinocandica]|uniref:DNA polymerase delta subunit 3 n=1 Tax=Venustampulla echinocandica TaxID=2656787 RepID=A0A370TWW2_9HELO|nr:Uncharacterized protein BP5553_04351 [Venustampulla echinocandica]RDL40011.1 Uncharacterized protein BP5553_04351 [Venustampulla echinocandica]
MADYKNYLAARILTEDKVVTYRLLSRAVKVHVNTAKEMLYEFHSQQNAKKPGTIHATYIVSGTKRKEEPATHAGVKKAGEDEYMQSSPFMGSSMPQTEDNTEECSVLSICLTREEDLEGLLAQYEQVTSIHIYSLGPHPLKDLQILSDVTREIQELSANDDPLESSAKYGTIVNPRARRRAVRRPPPAAVPVKPEPSKAKPADPKTAPVPKTEEPKAQPSSAKEFFGKAKEKPKPGNASSKESTPKPPPALKRDSSNFFKAFAKAKPKEGTDSSAAASPALSAAEDEPMKDVSDDEEETYVPPPQPSKEIVDSDRKKRKEREEALRMMMEDDEDEEPVVAEKVEAVEEEERPKSKSESVEAKEEPVVAGDGRKRGKRRVMKKKATKNAEGYLVTKEELVWESFSEDEPVAPPKLKTQTSATGTKGKKPAAKAGQGSIMSFFGKK